MSPDSRTIALVVPSTARIAGSSAEETLLQLVQLGWDAHVVYEPDGAGVPRGAGGFLELLRRGHDAAEPNRDWTAAALQDPRLRSRVHHACSGRAHGVPGWSRAAWLVRALVRNPRAVLRHRRQRSLPDDGGRHARHLDTILIALRPNLVHVQSTPSAHARMRLARLLGAKVVVSPDGHVLGDGSRRQALAVIPPVVDTSFFDPRLAPVVDARESRLRILSVGALHWTQGYEYALEAVRLLLDRGVDCVYRIVGEGEYARAVGFARHELGVAGAVELVGAVDVAALRAELTWAQVYLCPAVVEGVSATVVHAQAMGLPVVATAGSGLAHELVEQSRAGFVVPRRDPGALADKLELLSRDFALRRRLGEAARAAALERFALDGQPARFDELYRRTLNGP